MAPPAEGPTVLYRTWTRDHWALHNRRGELVDQGNDGSIDTFRVLAASNDGLGADIDVPLIALGADPGNIVSAMVQRSFDLDVLRVGRAGNQARDIANALARPLERAGIERGARCGYPIGLSYPPDWGERTMSLRPGDRSILEPGMTFHFMPALWLDDGGLEITEPIVITDTGVECLCATPREMCVKA